MKSLIVLRSKKPNFPRTDIHKKAKLQGKGWRKPKGRVNRVKRLGIYHGASPGIGYASPRSVRGLHPSGYKIVEVENINQLEGLDSKTTGIKLRKIGLKNKIMIVKHAIEKKLRILNLRKPEEFLKKFEKTEKKAVEKK
jgi:large subunit ribosomal protein L32e